MADQGNITSALTVADLNTKVNHEPRVSHHRLAEALSYGSAHKLAQLVDRHRGALERFGIILSTVDRILNEKGFSAGRPGKTYWLNKKQALYLCTKSEAPLATETTIQMVEVFDEYLTGKLKPVKVKAHRRSMPAPVKPAEKFGDDVNLLRDMVSALMSAHLRVEKGQSHDFGNALLEVFEDICLARDQPGWKTRGALLDWNHYRACYRFADKLQGQGRTDVKLPAWGFTH